MSAGMGIDLEAFMKLQRADGLASILAIGTANPSNAVDQSTYPDYYFRITGDEHNTQLKDKFKRICKFIHESWSVYVILRCNLLNTMRYYDAILQYNAILWCNLTAQYYDEIFSFE